MLKIFPKADVITPDNFYINVRFELKGSIARVRDTSSVIEETEALSFERKSKGKYLLKTASSGEWEVNKLYCNCK